jgi:LysR family transcriptional regulator for metE and metH
MKLEIRHLQLVQAITSEGSVTRAADRLNVTQSALSHQLREIEDRLGTPLFLRVNRRLALAPAGERLLQSAQRVLDELRLVEEDIGRLASHQDGVIRVSTGCYTCCQWLPPLLKPFHNAFARRCRDRARRHAAHARGLARAEDRPRPRLRAAIAPRIVPVFETRWS